MNVRAPPRWRSFFRGGVVRGAGRLYIVSDFSVVNVFENSHSTKPLLYKITGVWAIMRLMLLWVSILALFGGLVAAFGNNLPLSLRATAGGAGLGRQRVLSVHPDHLEPFLRIASPPIEAATSIRCCRTSGSPCIRRCSISLCRFLDFIFVRRRGAARRPDRRGMGALGAAVDAGGVDLLTLGIAMGCTGPITNSAGRLVFWDPVENASLMPWLAGTRCCTPPS